MVSGVCLPSITLNRTLTTLGLLLDIIGAVVLASPDIRWLKKLSSRLPLFRSKRYIDRCAEEAGNIGRGERIFRNDVQSRTGPVSESVFDFWCDTIEWATERDEIECDAISRHPSAGISYTPRGGVPDEDTVYVAQPIEFQRFIREYDARRYRVVGLTLLFTGFSLQLLSQLF